ncbi:response regulator transcription factor [Burkholderia anthina]|uniref:response regulator transcription factor n=1 Tax=Burkholderia anthina TaxID=179879 RepID=UPI001589758F|nr:response regulator transcription factor [Burkholderia anthina]
MRILFVTTPHPDAAWLYKALQESGHSLQRADDLRDGAFLSAQEHFDVIVAMASEPAGYPALLAALPSFAHGGSGATLVVVLGRALVQDRVAALRAGADACFSQPYSFIEMHERIQALRRMVGASAASDVQAASGVTPDTLTRELLDGELRLAVTRREYLLLECLMRQVNAPVAREQLIRYAWQDQEDVDPSSVNLVVCRLRRKLARFVSGVEIETVSRYGYQITFASR